MGIILIIIIDLVIIGVNLSKLSKTNNIKNHVWANIINDLENLINFSFHNKDVILAENLFGNNTTFN